MEDRSESMMQLDRKEDTADILSASGPAQCVCSQGKVIYLLSLDALISSLKSDEELKELATTALAKVPE